MTNVDMLPLILTSIAGLFVVVAGIWQFLAKHPDKTLRSLICQPSGLLMIAGAMVIIAGILTYQQNVSDYENTIASITGGDSLVHLESRHGTDHTRYVAFYIEVSGKHPVYDVQITIYRMGEKWERIEDSDNPTRLTRPFPTQYFSALSSSHPATRYPDVVHGWTTAEEDLNPPPAVRFAAVITTRNSYFVQYIRLDNVDNKWLQDWPENWIMYERGDLCSRCPSRGASDDLLKEMGGEPPQLDVLQAPSATTIRNAAIRRRRT